MHSRSIYVFFRPTTRRPPEDLRHGKPKSAPAVPHTKQQPNDQKKDPDSKQDVGHRETGCWESETEKRSSETEKASSSQKESWEKESSWDTWGDWPKQPKPGPHCPNPAPKTRSTARTVVASPPTTGTKTWYTAVSFCPAHQQSSTREEDRCIIQGAWFYNNTGP